jgi:hypothetical protein
MARRYVVAHIGLCPRAGDQGQDPPFIAFLSTGSPGRVHHGIITGVFSLPAVVDETPKSFRDRMLRDLDVKLEHVSTIFIMEVTEERARQLGDQINRLRPDDAWFLPML